MINSYKIFRGTAPGNETLLTTVAGMQTGGSYDDTLARNENQTYYYSDTYSAQAEERMGTSGRCKTCRMRAHRPSLRQR